MLSSSREINNDRTLKRRTVWEGQLILQLVWQNIYIKKTKKKAYALKELKEYRFPVNAYIIAGGKKTPNISKTKQQNIF